MSEEAINDAQMPDTIVLPEGFVLPDGVTELPVEYDLMAARELPNVSPTDVVRRSDRLAWLDVHGEVVVYLFDTDTSYVLNPMSAVAWQCLDGESTLAEIFADIADVYGVELAIVEADFVPIVAGWMFDDLVELVEEVQHG